MRGEHHRIPPPHIRVGLGLLVLHMLVSGVCATPPGPTYAFTCSPGWTLGYGKCYKFFAARHTYDDAQNICSNFGNGHIAIAKDNHVKAALVRSVVKNSYPTSDIWWQGASLPAGINPLSVNLVNGEVLDFRVGFLDNCEIQPGSKPYRRCLAMNANPNSYLYPKVYGSAFRPCKEKLPFVCVQECCPAGHPNYPSTGGMLKCVNGRCVPRFRKCDGVNDCGDNTDERDCNTVPGVNSFLYTGNTVGTFSLPGYGSYDHYQWSIEVNPGQQIFANISNLSIEKDADILYVWCGGRSLEKSALLGRISGAESFVGPLKCLSPFMTFVFYSDFNIQGSGFFVTWAAIPEPPRQTLLANTLSEGVLIMNPIPRGSRREWTIATDNKWLIVTLVRKRLNLPKGSSLAVFDGDSYDDTLLFTYTAGEEMTGDWLSALYIQSTGQYMSLCLYTPIDGDYGELEFIYYAGCHVELAATQAIIQNAGRYDKSPYPNFMHCTYYITTNSTLLDSVTGHFEFLEIIIGDVDIDNKDKLVILSGDVEVYNSMDGPTPPTIPATSQTVTIRFWTSGLRNDKGFSVGLSTGCEDLSFNVPGTIVVTNGVGQGATKTIRCEPGYYLAQEIYDSDGIVSGPVTITCLVNGWNTAQKPDCYRRICPDLPIVANAFIPDQTLDPMDGYKHEDVVRYECLPGFSFQPGPTSVTCNAGVWSDSPSCGGGAAATSCTPLTLPIDDNRVEALIYGATDTELYATLRYTCLDGYVLDGGEYRVCSSSGVWIPAVTAPTCIRKTCRLPIITNAVPWPINAANPQTFTSVAVTCQSGFTRVGSETIMCQFDQSFTALPTCIDIDECDPTNQCGTNSNCINIPGSYKCWCDPGYVLAANELSCIDEVDCTGTANRGPCDSLRGRCADTAGGYTCFCDDPRYELFTSNGFNGFSNPPGDDPTAVGAKYRVDHTCVLVQCDYDHTPQNRIPFTILARYKPAYHVDDQISFLCEETYIPSRTPTTSTCQIDGSWSPDLITCIKATCKVPDTGDSDTQPEYRVAGTNGVLAIEATVEALSSVDLTCLVVPGRPTQFTVQRMCTWDSVEAEYSFEGDEPYACGFTLCLEDTAAFSIGNGFLIYRADLSGSSPSPDLHAGAAYEINCNTGSTFSGSTNINGRDDNIAECGNDGLWLIGTAICPAAQCDSPLYVIGATQNDNGFAVGAIVTYTCYQTGYELRPTSFASFTCNDNGAAAPTWSPDPGLTSLECVDNEAPVITFCPLDFMVELNDIVTLPTLTATDNSGGVVITTTFASPNEGWIDESPFVISPLVVTYRVQGLDPDSPDDTTCTFTVTAPDESVPNVVSPPSSTYYAISGDPVAITDILPGGFEFSTDAGATVVLSPPNFTPVLGTTQLIAVTATVTGSNGNTNTVTFNIEVQDSCVRAGANLANPANGGTTCTTSPRECTVTCNAGFKLAGGNTVYDDLVYVCNTATGIWNSPDGSVFPHGVTPSCASTQTSQVLANFDWFWDILSGGDPTNCESTYVAVFEAIATVTPDSASFTCPNGVVATIQTPITTSTLNAAARVLSMDVLMIMVKQTGGKPTSTETSDCIEHIRLVATRSTTTFNFFELDPTNLCRTARFDWTGSSSNTIDMNECALDIVTGSGDLCVQCPAGTFFMTGNGCLPCPVNTFSASEGASECTACPTGTGTRSIGRTACESTCSSIGNGNSFSVTGVQPCTPCPVNQQASTSSPNTQCEACPANTGNTQPGAPCISKCAAGSFSPNGLIPCKQCVVGTHQSDVGQTSCTPCIVSFQTTASTGSTAQSDCLALSQLSVTPTICTGTCVANGVCEIDNNRPVCTCAAGFTGATCASVINNCSPDPCNGGTCISLTGTIPYICNCPDGFSGDNCLTNNNCATANLCNSGKCQEVDHNQDNSGFKCVCQQNFGGPLCDNTGVNPCANDLCVSGTCVPEVTTRYQCNCSPGWTGRYCDAQIEECASDPCRNGGNCVDGTNSYTCVCTDYWNGPTCGNLVDSCTSASTCSGGVCITDYMDGPSKCRCDASSNLFPLDPTRIPEEPDLDIGCVRTRPCDQSENQGICLNGAACVNTGSVAGVFSCVPCDDGWTGNRCQTPTDECGPNPCGNGGTCVDEHMDYSCRCAPGWTGKNCNNDINECDDKMCDPVGTANPDNERSYCQCVCEPGYTGDQCETNWDDCSQDSCLHGGTCTDGVNGFSCVCTGDWFGNICQNSPTPCLTNTCQNGGQCRPLNLCACPSSTYGSNCDSMTDICSDVTGYCQNGGDCTSLTANAGSCKCPPDYTGERCNLRANACDNNVCKNGGTCVSTLDAFMCKCRPGYMGQVCEVGPNNCVATSCENGGTCVDSPYGAICSCPAGYGGATCGKQINRDYDLHCDGSNDEESVVFQMNPFKLFSDSFSIAAWVRFTDDTTGVFLSFYKAAEAYNNPNDPLENKMLVLTLDETEVKVKLDDVIRSYKYTQPNGEIYEINDGQWYKIVVTCNGTTGEFTVYINTVRVAQEVLINVDNFENAWLALGSGFKGSVSQVQVWDRELPQPDVIVVTIAPDSPNPPALVPHGLVMDYTRWVFYPGCWLNSPTEAGKPYTPLAPEQPLPSFKNCPDEPVTAIGTERRTVVEWEELEAENSATSIWCRYKSGRAFTWGLYTNVCIIKNAQGFTATCKFDIIVRKLNCPDPLIYNGQLPPNCQYLDEFGGVRICEPACPSAVSLVSVAQPLSYMCDKLGSFNPSYPYNEGRIPACGVEADYKVLYNVVIQASYPNVSLCQAVMEVGGISEELRVRIKELNDDLTYMNAEGQLMDSPLCEEDDCSDVVMQVDCPGTHIRMEIHYTPIDITYTKPGPDVPYDNARDLLQEILIDQKLFDSDNVYQGTADPGSLCFDLFPVCRPGAGYLKGRCVVCAKGQYAPKKDEPCRMCPVGTYQDNTASVNCKPCQGGKTTEYWGAVSESECIWNCDPGQYYNIDFRKCKPCPIGTYSEDYGMTRCCKPCQAYQTTRYEGSDSEDKCVDTCPDGHKLLYGDHCVPCERGYYRQRDLQDDCEPCPLGFTTLHSASVYLEDCSFPDCAPGSYINGTECKPCPLGYYQPASSQLECIKCLLDQTTLNIGSVKTAQCIYACPPGAELIDGYKCKPCEIGFWKSTGMPDEFCQPCIDGFITQTTGAISIAKCIVPACKPGEFLDDNNCKPCPVDTYQPDYWKTFCQDCPAGTSTAFITGSDSESDCKRYCPEGQEDQGGICLPCPLGTWKGVAGYSICANCTGGRFTAGTGSTSLIQCDREHCYPGAFLTPDLVCEECERGYYQPEFQQSWCRPCLNGLTTIGTGNNKSSDCILDCYSGQGWDHEAENCVLCTQATYRTQGVEDLCTDCSRGYTTPAHGSYTAADCTQVACYPGYYLVVDVNACKECPIGTYQPDKYKLSCKHCPQGTTTVQQASKNHTDCKRECPPGYETDTYYNCKLCRRGYYRSEYDGFDCVRCPAGATTLNEGATSQQQCTLGDCLAGYYQNGQVCRPCPYGTYQPNKWQPSCIPCGKYYTTPTTGSTSPLDCTVKASCNITCIPHASGGVCEATDYGHICSCRPGWTGYHPNCMPLCSTKYCSNYEDCYTDEHDQPYCRCRPGWDSKCKDEQGTNMAILIGAPVAGGIIFILLLCIGIFACGCCGCTSMGQHYHRHSNKGSPSPSIHSSMYGIAPEHQLFQQPCVRYAAQPMNQQPYNPTSPMIATGGNETTVIRIQANTAPVQPVAQPAAPKLAPGISIDYGYSNPNLNSRFKFFEDNPANKKSNNIRDPNVATMNFD